MRLLMTVDAVGGVWDFAVTLCAELAAEYGVVTTLVCMGPAPSPPQVEAAEAVPGLTLIQTPHALEWMPDASRDLEDAGRVIRNLVTTRRPHIVHFNQHCFGSLRLPVPSVVVSHSDSLSWQYYQSGAIDRHDGWAAYRDVVRAGLRGASAVVAPTAFVADALRALYEPRLAVRVIHNGVSLMLDAMDHQSCPAARPIDVMGAGRVWDSAKNLSLLAEAARLLSPSRRVEIAGSFTAPHGGAVELEQYQGVTFLGHLARRELHARLMRTRVFVAPARYEPFGQGLVEAALAGCALVAADIPSFREIWADTATYVGHDAPWELASRLTALLADEGERVRHAERARARALRRYSPSRMAASYMDLYQGLLRREG